MGQTYTNIVIHSLPDENKQEEVLAILNYYSEFESAWQQNDDLIVSYLDENFPSDFKELLEMNAISNYTIEKVAKKNWNEEFESNFTPISILDGKWTVRATFHPPSDSQFEIVIDPKMSFGTGHHATTRMAMTIMDALDWKDKTVLDYGSGTGILAIMAAKLCAKNLIAIDNEEWAYLNSIENAQRNEVPHIKFYQSTLEDALEKEIIPPLYQFDIIIANITKNVLTQSAESISKLSKNSTQLILSGFYKNDVEDILAIYLPFGFSLSRLEQEDDNWVAILLERK